MDWRREAKNDLRDLPYLEHCIKVYPKQIQALEADYVSLKGCATDSSPVQGGANGREDSLINNIVKREKLKRNYDAALMRYNIILSAFNLLTDEQKMILDRFYIHRQFNHVEKLCEDLNIEKSHVYRKKDEALDLFTKAMYGFTEY